MFTAAVDRARRYTFPYVGFRHRGSGEVFSTIASVVVLSRDGWVLTAAHVLREIQACEAQRAQAAEFAPNAPERANLIAHHAEVWAVPGWQQQRPRLLEARVDPLADIALARLDPAPVLPAEDLPLLRTADEPVTVGLSVARMGYPFHDAPATYEPEADNFRIGEGAFPVPMFVNEGIVSRFRNEQHGDRSALFIETSNPGLRGQSGGPLFDTQGRVCGIQSKTGHLDLGFDARYVRDGEEIVERQFMNVGLAAHVNEIARLAGEQGLALRQE